MSSSYRSLRPVPRCTFVVAMTVFGACGAAHADGSADAGLPASVGARADPSKDTHVTTLLNQQAAAARRLVGMQIINVQGRLQALRDGDAAGCRPAQAPPATAASAPDAGNRSEPPGPSIGGTPVRTQVSLPLRSCRSGDGATDWTAGALEVGAANTKASGQGFGFHSRGVTLGADQRLGREVAVGLGLGLAREQADAASDGTSNAATALHATAYLSYRPSNALFVDAMAGYGELMMRSARRLEERGSVASDRRGIERFASLAAGYRLALAGADVAPYTRLDAMQATLRANTDPEGGADALQFRRQSLPSLKLAFGVEGSSRIETRFGGLNPRGRVEVRHELEAVGKASMNYADAPDGTAYALDASGTGRNVFALNLGAILALRDSWSIGGGYAFDYSGSTRMSRLDLKLSWQLP